MPDDPNDPLDYFNPYARPQHQQPAPEPEPLPVGVVPMEFDTLLTRSRDHAAVAAIETALRAMQIDTFRANDEAPSDREVSLYVRADDFQEAALLAAEIFVRRQRVKATNPPRDVVDPKWPDVFHPGGVVF